MYLRIKTQIIECITFFTNCLEILLYTKTNIIEEIFHLILMHLKTILNNKLSAYLQLFLHSF